MHHTGVGALESSLMCPLMCPTDVPNSCGGTSVRALRCCAFTVPALLPKVSFITACVVYRRSVDPTQCHITNSRVASQHSATTPLFDNYRYSSLWLPGFSNSRAALVINAGWTTQMVCTQVVSALRLHSRWSLSSMEAACSPHIGSENIKGCDEGYVHGAGK